MLTRLFIIIICFLFGILSCTDKTEQVEIKTIRINPNNVSDDINLSEIADSVKCIKLETSPDCMLGRLHSIIIKKKYIYAWDVSQQTIFVFNKEGKYISKLDKQGRGPDEYLHIGAVFIDKDEKYVDIVNSASEKTQLMRYSNISFKFQEQRPMPKISANSFRKVGNNYYFATQQIENIVDKKRTNAGIIIVKNGTVKKTLFDKNIVTHNSAFSPNCESFAYIEDDELFVSIMYDNTFYQLHDMDAYPILRIDFGKYGFDNSIGLQSLDEQLEFIKKTNGKAFFPVLNINNSEIMTFSYYFKNDNKERMFRETDFRQYIHLKKNNKVLHTRKILNDITSFPEKVYLSSYFFQVAHDVWHNGYLVDVVLPQYYFTPDNKTQTNVDGIGEITIEDNPIIVLMKFKNEL